MFYLDKTPTGRHAPNWQYYLLVMHHDYGKKIRQHGKPKELMKVHKLTKLNKLH